ncbi:type II toxin-antitoxin system PemK/MazF family toxin [Aliarcobacter butzleri]|uniref:type II toxin-antitoxin system PemK/MazF family toxin n=1 Tax=Aliarcobacter butzleri TaxID=28197 RepID=UPI0021B244ED|nr:type II toxin-antitoxin system PemK/MazF family toxin [Aliarcobacter butzleri]MCT7550956.1 type II toxin-antitoxin system PemK/MazF family toxin [Aliarcobacter butzleri]MCT7559926.1 type II toxin-antitoxin system PemK/MazF family toxin [Aliarcobacter butzleri]MCT7606786.1 type II toxin-antitoxin system PemK/MazF family toxin [Aliarcobacter butzleri]
MVGKIYLAKIYFTDLNEYKIRPVLVIKVLDEDCICLQLTTQYYNSKILVSNDDLIDGTLKKESLIVVPKNFTLHKSILFKYLGKLNDEKQKEIFKIFCEKIGCNN